MGISTLAKQSLVTLKTIRFHRIHRNLAQNALQTVERQKGKTNKRSIKLANAYAREVLGSKLYAPWLHVYSASSGTFREGWIPDNYYRHVVVPKIQGDYGRLSFNNMLSNSCFKTEHFPDLAYYVNGQWLSKDLEVVRQSILPQIIFSEGDLIVFKADHSFQGKGVHLMEKKSFTTQNVERLGNGVFQRYIQQHPFFDDFGIAATTTVRLTTIVNTNREASCRTAYLRMGRISDTHVKSSSQIKVVIDLTSGELSEQGHLANWESIRYHPDTQMAFKGKVIPFFNKAVTLCLKLHSKALHLGAIGWDVAIDPLGEVHLLEWNGYHNDIKYSEATQGPCFADLGWEQLWKDT